MKTSYEESGYHLFRQAFPRDQVIELSDMAYELLTPYRGRIRRQNGKLEFNEYLPEESFRHWGTDHGRYTVLIANPLLNAHLGLPEGLEPIAERLRALITSQALYERLHGLDGAEHYTVHQTILFIAAATTALHIDSWSMDTAPRGGAHTVWIPLEDMNHESGAPCVIPWPRGKLLTEEDLGLGASAERPFAERYDRYQKALAQRMLETSPDIVTAFMRRGDFMVWSSLTPHCSLPSRPRYLKRLSIQLLVRPSHTRWGNFAIQPAEATPDRVEKVTDRFSFNLAP
jgi:hypothetical protein